MRHAHPGDERISGTVPARSAFDPPAKKMLAQKRKALLDSIRELEECIGYIDWKQDFYDEVLSGARPYVSNLIPAENLMDS